MGIHKGMCGHVGPGSIDFKEDNTLSDYINRKSKHDALANAKSKMSFNEWFTERYKNQKWLHEDLKNSMYRALQDCWNVSKENS